MSSTQIQKRILRTASCDWQICQLSPSIVSAATNTCCGDKRGKLCLPWRGYGADDSRAAQRFHFRSRAKRERFVARIQMTTREKTHRTKANWDEVRWVKKAST